jgi:hypothetical protein
MITDINAPNVASRWFQSRAVVDPTVTCNIRLPDPNDPINKACITFESASSLGSFTLWGNGSVSWLFVSAIDGELLVARDSQCQSEAEVVETLESAWREVVQRARLG